MNQTAVSDEAPARPGLFSVVVLVGMPGSGKSTIARALSRRLQLALADSDQAIEQRLGWCQERCGEPMGLLLQPLRLLGCHGRWDLGMKS